MRYFFHNIYGDEQGLLDTLPADVRAIPFGWTPEVEATRNMIIELLGTTVSTLPSVMFFIPEYKTTIFINGEDKEITVPQHWEEVRVSDMNKPWSWEAIDAEIQARTPGA